jgi:predicted nucleic acid-binding protein
MSATTFVDTNILVWTYDPLDARKRERALQRLEQENESGVPVVSTNVLGELYVALTKKKGRSAPIMDPDDAADAVRFYRALTVVPVDSDQLEHALFLRKEYQQSFWDALNLASAIAARCTLFLTEDAQSNAVIEGVRFENPLLGR